jgi:hypothetical protein
MRVADALYVVSLSVDPDREAEFNRYYHGEHIPAVLADCGDLRTVRRYEQFGVDGSLRWYERQFLTIYELDSGRDLARLSDEGVLPSTHPAMTSWQEWRPHLHDVQRRAFRLVYEHPRVAWDGAFGSRPFFLVTADIAADDEPEFARWYHEEYLPRNVAEVPTWAAVRRYESAGGGPRRTFVVYEAWDEAGLARSLASMRGAARLEENLAWHRWEPAISYEDAAMFRPIYRWPG